MTHHWTQVFDPLYPLFLGAEHFDSALVICVFHLYVQIPGPSLTLNVISTIRCSSDDVAALGGRPHEACEDLHYVRRRFRISPRAAYLRDDKMGC